MPSDQTVLSAPESLGPSASAAVPSGAYLYRSVRDLLAARIAAGDLAEGAVLKESSIATQLGISRAPVRRALDMLRSEGVIRAAEGQGFVIGQGEPQALSPRELNEILSDGDEKLDRSASWERIFAEISAEVMTAMPFGTYRIQEAELGDYHHVSRTVAREVLWRLMDRRLIEKNRKSHWIVGQMTARDIRDTLEMRQLLEPCALGQVAGQLDPDWLAALAERIELAIAGFPACGGAAIDEIEFAMFQQMYEGLRNVRMLASLRRNQLSLWVARLFRQHFPIRDDRAALHAYGEIVHHLRGGSVDVAQVLLRSHLIRLTPLALARLRVLSVLPPPRTVPYLIAMH